MPKLLGGAMTLVQVKSRAINLLLLLLAMPLAGIALQGQSIASYLDFPFKTRIMDHHGFSWMVFIFWAAMVLGPVMLVQGRIWRTPKKPASQPGKNPWPWWGTGGVVLLGLSWYLAWTRLPWFGWGQRYTFFPLWLSFIVVLNALTFRRSGQCLLAGPNLCRGLVLG